MFIHESIGQKRKSDLTATPGIDQVRMHDDSFTMGAIGSIENFNASLSKGD